MKRALSTTDLAGKRYSCNPLAKPIWDEWRAGGDGRKALSRFAESVYRKWEFDACCWRKRFRSGRMLDRSSERQEFQRNGASKASVD